MPKPKGKIPIAFDSSHTQMDHLRHILPYTLVITFLVSVDNLMYIHIIIIESNIIGLADMGRHKIC